MYDLWEDRDSHQATEAEAHVEWHLNSGVPMGQPCPWDACDPEEEHDEELIQLLQPITEEQFSYLAYGPTILDQDDLPF